MTSEEKIPSTILLYHGRSGIEVKDGKKFLKGQRAYTVMFKVDKTNRFLYISWAKPRTKMDKMDKETGRRTCIIRMNRLVNYVLSEVLGRTPKLLVATDFKKYLPGKIAKTLPFYVWKAKRYFKIDDDYAIFIRVVDNKNEGIPEVMFSNVNEVVKDVEFK